MKVNVINSSGLLLILPREDRAAMLFLEWIVIRKKELKLNTHINPRVHSDYNFLAFEIVGGIRESYEEAAYYINSNL